MSLSSLWRLTPLAAALLICSQAQALELQPQVITGNPLAASNSLRRPPCWKAMT
jgi:iron complex outermembrane recepter protein